jgi:hypothetical protein
MTDLSQFKIWTVEEFERAFLPLPSSNKPNGGGTRAQAQGAVVDEIDEADLPDDLLEWTRDGVPAGEDRSVVFFRVVKALKRFDYSAEAIFDLLARYPDGIAQKYLDRKESGSRARLRLEVRCAYDKPAKRTRAPKAAPPMPPAPPPVAPVAPVAPGGAGRGPTGPSQSPAVSALTVPSPPSAQLAKTVAVYRKWLALENDWPVYVLLGAVVANLFAGKPPVWLGIVGPSSSAKTELLNSVSPLPYVHEIETVSVPGLISGTPKKSRTPGATGGVLREMGAFGVLLFPDFGSVLSLRQDAQDEMLAALRRVCDGSYTRRVGMDGGHKLEWAGKAGCLFGATQKYDSQHAVIGWLGDRFVLFRLEALFDEQMDKCWLEEEERAKLEPELAQAAADLLASLPDPLPAPEKMTPTEHAALKRTLRLVIRLRAGVVRDNYKRDIDDVHDPEGPARFSLALRRLFAGLVLIGVSRGEACAIVDRIAFDSTPRLRLKAFDSLTDEWRSTSEIAAEINLPLTTARRALENLMMQKLALREERPKALSRGKSGVFSGSVESWKHATTLCHPKSGPPT